MPMVFSSMSSTLLGLLASTGNAGPDAKKFCDAVSQGAVQSVVGKTAQTVDTGTGAAPGTGVGAGIIVAKALCKSAIFSACSAGGMSGPKLMDFCDAAATAYTMELAKASITSTHTTVYLGNGVISAIPVTPTEFGMNIQSAGASFGLAGPTWPMFATSLGTGLANPTLAGTGKVTITGVPPGSPSPATGVGVATIS